MATHTILISSFSPTPAGRYRSDGPYSGEIFREDVLYPALQAHEVVEVNLDNTLGFGSSFLEEVFGGLVRKRGMSVKDLRSKLKIASSREFYKERIWKYIEEAAALVSERR